jgi:transglutaminase-like putative cysteine protease
VVSDLSPFLEPNPFVDCDHPAIAEYAREHTTEGADPIDNAVRLYGAIRDGFRYNPWRVFTTREAFRASDVLLRDRAEGGHCIDKANLLAACARRGGIPSRLHFANVRNHIGTKDLERRLGTSLLVFHGYVELHLEGKWVAATPAFNKELCEYLGVTPLVFDGRHDSIFQEYDQSGGRFMEYVRDYGSFPDVPFDLMIAEWNRYYPEFMQNGWPTKGPNNS